MNCSVTYLKDANGIIKIALGVINSTVRVIKVEIGLEERPLRELGQERLGASKLTVGQLS